MPKKYPIELLDRAVREAQQSGRPIARVARSLGIGDEVHAGVCGRRRRIKARVCGSGQQRA